MATLLECIVLRQGVGLEGLEQGTKPPSTATHQSPHLLKHSVTLPF